MASRKIGSNEKLEVLADLIYLARHSPAGAELQLRCLDLAAESDTTRRGVLQLSKTRHNWDGTSGYKGLRRIAQNQDARTIVKPFEYSRLASTMI
jgi:hypothetical protein